MEANSSACLASLTETSSGRCRSTLAHSSSRLAPAARATILKSLRQRLHHGKTLPPNRACRAENGELLHRTIHFSVLPNWLETLLSVSPNLGHQILPLTERRQTGMSVLPAGQVNPNPIVPDNRDGQNQRIDSVKNAAMARKQAARILDARASLVRGLKKIPDLSRDIARRPPSPEGAVTAALSHRTNTRATINAPKMLANVPSQVFFGLSAAPGRAFQSSGRQNRPPCRRST